MSIAHDAWLFSPWEFSKAMSGLSRVVAEDHATGYKRLREKVIASLEESLAFAKEYGGWDRPSIISELPVQYEGDVATIELCFILLLYSELLERNVGISLGLAGLWRSLEIDLESLGWEARERETLLRGHNFGL